MVELNWNSFAEPTPGAESWQPNSDSVPVADGLQDPRFNKDSLTEKHKTVLKRERRHGFAVEGLSESTGPAHPQRPSRVTDFPHTISISDEAQHPMFPPLEATKSVETQLPAPTRALSSTVEWIKAPRFADGFKGTMKTLPAEPVFQHRHTLQQVSLH
jgi:hypothetical protein